MAKPSDGRDAELLVKAEACSVYNFDSVEFVECKHALWNDILAALRGLPSPADNPSREGLAQQLAFALRKVRNENDDHDSEAGFCTDQTCLAMAKESIAFFARLATNPPDPDSMNDIRALQDMTLAHNVREATIRECAEKSGDDGLYLVWSNQHHAWWRPDSHGYTDNVKLAGRYSRAEAISISFRGRDGWFSPKGVPDELAIAERDVPVFAASPVPLTTAAGDEK